MRAPLLSALLVIALSACTSSQDVLEPSALLDSGSQTAPTQPQFPLTQPASPSTAAIRTDARIQFAPVVGAAETASAPLSARLSSAAGARGVSLVQAGDSSATHVMKGYFSAISDAGETTVIYVWDVLDTAGNRVHRIQGQSKAPARGGEGWASVQPATMEAIADQTVEQLVGWLVTRQG